MIVGLLIGFAGGVTVPTGIALLGVRFMSKHPEYIMSYMGKKMVHAIKTDIKQAQ